jgi:hypothetical protein
MPDPTIKQLISSSGLSFSGSVESLGIGPATGLVADDRTAVVQVEQVLHGPEQLAVPPGGKIVVQLSPDLPPLSPGDRATFFTNGLVYGDELVVAEVGRLTADAGTARTETLAGRISVEAGPHDQGL